LTTVARFRPETPVRISRWRFFFWIVGAAFPVGEVESLSFNHGAKCGNAHDIGDADCSENEQYRDRTALHECRVNRAWAPSRKIIVTSHVALVTCRRKPGGTKFCPSLAPCLHY
jgi:hypothetical protein